MSRAAPSSRVLAIGLGVAVALVAPAARAYHEGEARITDETAYTLPKGNLNLGPIKQGWGVVDRVTVSTYLIPWFLRFANANVKVRFYSGDPLSLSASLGFVRFVPEVVANGAGDAELGVLPLDLIASYRIDDRFTLSGGPLYTVVTLKGSYDPAALKGLAAVTNLQLRANLEYRMTRVTAWVLALRYLAFQNASGRISTTYAVDDKTTLHLESVASTNALNFPHAFSVVPSAVFSWKTFNLRVGLGYGNYSVPLVNLVVPKKTVVPDLDLYFVF